MKRLLILMLTGSMLFWLAACGDDDDTIDVTPSVLSADAGADQEVEVGELVTLNGSASSDSEGRDFTFDWSITTRPTGSSASLEDADSPTPSFTPDEPGEYVIELLISNEFGEDSDEVTIVAIQPLVTLAVLLENSDDFTILADAVSRFSDLVEALSDENAELTVFAPADEVFEAFFAESDDFNSLDDIPEDFLYDILRYHVIPGQVLFADDLESGESPETLLPEATININVTAQGIVLNENVPVAVPNTEALNGVVHIIGGLLLPPAEPIEINQSISSDRVLTRVTPPGMVDYYATSSINIDAKLSINPGVIIEFSESVAWRVDNGTIIASGTAEDSIIFRGRQDLPEYWRGIRIGSNEVDNELNYVIIDGAGDARQSVGVSAAAVLMTSSSRLQLKNSRISRSGNFGLYIAGSSDMVHESNRYRNNTTPIYVSQFSAYRYFDSDSDYTGNSNDRIDIASGNNLSDDITISPLNIPYGIIGTHTINGDLTISAGATFLANDNAGLDVQNGTINVEGTENARVRFYGRQEVEGYWRGIRVATQNDNIIRYADIDHGGSDRFSVGSTAGGLVVEGGRLTLENSRIRKSEQGGLNLRGDLNNVTLSNNTYTENQYPVTADSRHFRLLDSGSDYTGNTNDRIEQETNGSTVASNRGGTISKLNVPYRLRGQMAVNGDITIEPGTIIEGFDDAGIRVREDATFIAEGTSDDKIIFRGAQDLTGYWRGIMIQTNNDNRIRHAEIINAGSQRHAVGSQAGAVVISGGRLTIRDTRIAKSGNFGIRSESNSDVTIDNITYDDNDSDNESGLD